MELLKEEFSPVDFKATKTNCIKYSRQDFLQLPYITTDFEWKDYSPAVFRFLFNFLSSAIIRPNRFNLSSFAVHFITRNLVHCLSRKKKMQE